MEKSKNSELTFDDQTGRFPQLEGMFAAILAYVATELKLPRQAVESLTLADDSTVQQLNREYRHADRPTDVLSFAFGEAKDDGDLPFMDLGDVVISVDTASRQAREFNHPTVRELAFLFIHGTLHNLGYDHARSAADAEIMFALQNRLLDSFAWDWSDARWQPLK